MEIALAIIGIITEYTVEPIGRQLGYLINYNDNIYSLKAKVVSLKNSRDGIEGMVGAADRNGEVVRPDVKNWITNVNRIADECEHLYNNEVNENQTCSLRSCPNVVTRYKVSKKAKKMTLVVDELLRDSKFDIVSFPAPPPKIGALSARHVEAFESRTSTFKQIMEALKDDKTNVIGVYGMGGIGKTTLVKDVAKQAEDYKLFDEVTMAVVSQTPSITKIQDEIAATLGLKLDEKEGVLVRAARLCKRIMKMRRVLVILDDMWIKLNLEDIGIPRGDVHKGCKILLTTRDQHVCVEMGSQLNFAIKVLSEQEAWKLFREKAGDIVDSPDLQPLAIKVTKECAGLPLAIVTVAGALMKIRDLSVWRDALRRLQNPSSKSIKGVTAMVYSSLKLSYDNLRSEEVKSCFLLCCLAPEDSNLLTNQLVRMGMGLRLFNGACTWEEVRDIVSASINELKTCCLLLDNTTENCVRMHNVVRDFATSVASESQLGIWATINLGRSDLSNYFFALDNNDTTISLHNNFHQLPPQIVSPSLKLLLLQDFSERNPYVRIPEKFFERVQELRVLIMANVVIPTVPSLLLSLVKLRMLCLKECKVEDLHLIGELKGLEILSITRCDIYEFPKEIGQLTRLRVLDLSNNYNRMKFPNGVLSSLSQLEALYMSGWNFWHIKNSASLDELKGLSFLSCLDIEFEHVKDFPQDLHWPRLSEFRVNCGRFYDAYQDYIMKPRTLSLFDADSYIASHGGFKMLLNKAESLIVKKMDGLEYILTDLKRGGFPTLKCLRIEDDNTLEYVVSTVTEGMAHNVFPVLEILELKDVSNLKEIYHGQLMLGSLFELRKLLLENLGNLETLWMGNASLPNLASVSVRSCRKLKKLYSQNMLQSFGQLHEISLYNCPNLEEVFAYDGVGEATTEVEIVLSKLKILRLDYVPNLTTFCSSKRSDVLSDGRACPPVTQAFFCEKIILPTLEVLHIADLKILERIWYKQLSAESFCRLRELSVTGCDCLRNFFTPSIVQGLLQLCELSITKCSILEQVLVDEMEEQRLVQVSDLHDNEALVFPCLEKLVLDSLPNLTSFYLGNLTLEFPSLKIFSSYECPQLQTFSLGLVITTNLRSIIIGSNFYFTNDDLNSCIQQSFQPKEIFNRPP